ncbi:hypothetical protein M413DRAFT_366774 [Hebeloma cylindrosporum]|uniref:Uncharacterized protein n=1 Tax=Hebeloma cylindrosporum TaxID=76867 RepID=A0A0C3C7V6_HEBCY|nr:hypothetical protein M413DRAFT_366774 [Hebeloma cylindrosporum h7]
MTGLRYWVDSGLQAFMTRIEHETPCLGPLSPPLLTSRIYDFDNFLYSLNAYNVIQTFLPPDGLAPAVANPDGNEQSPPPRAVKTLPNSLHRMLLHWSTCNNL